jgi:hypothetical protein
MFIVAQFTTAKLWNQPRCLSTNEGIKKMWYICSMEYYPAISKNEIMSCAGKWMELEVILSKISQTYKDKYQVFFHMQNLDPYIQKTNQQANKQKEMNLSRRLLGGQGKKRGEVQGAVMGVKKVKVYYMYV